MARNTTAVKGWFLTYPQNDTPKESLMDLLKPLGSEILVCEEKHEDGSPHLHAFIKLNTPITHKKAPDVFNLLDKTGDYQPARSWRACEAYVKKDGCYITHNCDVENAQIKKRKRNEELLSKPIHELVDQGLISLMMAPQIKKAKIVYEESKIPLVDHDDVKGEWYHGESGTGKSRTAREKYPNAYLKAANKWWDGYIGQEFVIIDDLDEDCLGHYLKIWGDRYACTGEIKGGTVNLNFKKIIVTSNFSISELFENKQKFIEPIKRRFHSTHFN